MVEVPLVLYVVMWIATGVVAWVLVAIAAGLLIGGMIRRRNQQVASDATVHGIKAPPGYRVVEQDGQLRIKRMVPQADCENCDGVGCMACRTREWHDACVMDCPDCCAPDGAK